jgi:hypothetical protein
MLRQKATNLSSQELDFQTDSKSACQVDLNFRMEKRTMSLRQRRTAQKPAFLRQFVLQMAKHFAFQAATSCCQMAKILAFQVSYQMEMILAFPLVSMSLDYQLRVDCQTGRNPVSQELPGFRMVTNPVEKHLVHQRAKNLVFPEC